VLELLGDVVGLEERLASPRPELVERDAHGDDAQPRVDATVLPLVLREALDHAGVGLAQRVLGARLAPEPGQEHRAVEQGAVGPEQPAQSDAIACLGAHAELALQLRLQAGHHGAHDTRSAMG